MERETGIQLAQKIIQQEIETLSSLSEGLGDAFWRTAETLGRCEGIIWITGIGTSATIGMRLAHLLTCCGARSMFLSPADGLHGHTGVMKAGDVLVALSRGGESAEVIQMCEISNGAGIPAIAFVHNVESTLSKMCSLVLPIHSKQEFELMGYVATTSTVAYSSMSDALCAIVREMRGYTPEQFTRTHPGGAVGKALHEKASHK